MLLAIQNWIRVDLEQKPALPQQDYFPVRFSGFVFLLLCGRLVTSVAECEHVRGYDGDSRAIPAG